jgi:hypothetical protein
LSFFDEADEPRRVPRPRRAPRSGGGAGGNRPPMDHQTLLVRRLVAAGAVVVVVILLVFLVKGCVDSRREAALKDYNSSVRTLMGQSKSLVSKPLFDALSGASGQQGQQIQETINQLAIVAQEQLSQAQRFDTPGEMSQAQGDLQLVLSLRHDGVQQIADLIQSVVGKSAGASTAVNRIAGQMRAFDASDVVYSQRVAPLILRALKNDGIAASYDGTAGEQVLPESSFLPSLSWINPTFVASALGASTGSTTPSGTPTPGLHGHQLDSVAVGNATLSASGSNRIPSSPLPTFTVTFTNGGEHVETNVKVTITITGAGAPVTAQTTVATTNPGMQSTANVQLTKPPPTSGPVTIKVTVEKVPGEQSVANNTQSYSALFE